MAELSKRHKRALKLKRENTLLKRRVALQQAVINQAYRELLDFQSKQRGSVELIKTPSLEEIQKVESSSS